MTIKQVCEGMFLSQVGGSWEQTFANAMGITQSVNGSWIQAIYPKLLDVQSQLVNQTYPGIDHWYLSTVQFYDVGQLSGDVGYSQISSGVAPLTIPQGGDYRKFGTYTFDGSNWNYNSDELVSWIDQDLIDLCRVDMVNDIQNQAIAANTSSISTNTTNIATNTANISTNTSNISSNTSNITTNTNSINSINTTIAGITASISTPSYNNAPGRPVNSTSFQISTTKRTRVSYTVTLTTALSLVNLNSAGQVILEISANNSTWVTINSAGVSKALGLGLSLNETTYANIQGEIPIGYYCRLRSVTSGGATTSFSSGQEVQY